MVLQNVIRADSDDVEKMRKQCKDLFLKSHPEFKGMVLTDRFMFKKIVSYYLD